MSQRSTGRSGPTPYYDQGGITIYHGDIKELWDQVSDRNLVSVVVTDPPYGMAYDSRRKKRERIAGDDSTELRDWMLEQWEDRPALVFGTWRAGRPICRTLLVWDKLLGPGMGDLSLPWGPGSEEIYVRGKGWVKAGKRQTNVLRFKGHAARDAARPDHPTPKPVELMIHLLERCPAGTVLDPFMGAGATLLAAQHLGRPAIGVELDERYCEIAVKRLEEKRCSLTLEL